jgi:acyl-CoA thioesterase-1
MLRRRLLLSAALLSVLACQRAPAELDASTTQDASAGNGSVTQAELDLPRVVFLGDSLTAGLGLDADQTFPAVLEQRLADEGLPIDMVNAGVSGDTSKGGLNRLPWLLRQHPDVLVVCLGGNDGLRGQPVANLRNNLEQIIRLARDDGASVLLLGLELPPNYGPDYTRAFHATFEQVAEDLDVPLVPSLLEGVGGHPDLNQADGIHPTAEGQRLVAGNVLPKLEELLRALRGRDAR